MKVLLQTHIPKIGGKGEVVEVSDGYAKNALFPKKLAVPATQHIISTWEQKKQKESMQKEERKKALKNILSEVQKHVFIFSVKTGKSGEVFTSIHQEEIQKALIQFLSTQNKLFENEDVHIELKPIKDLGDHEIEVRLGREDYIQKTSIHIQIIAEEA